MNIEIFFKGYFGSKYDFPEKPGIYCIYSTRASNSVKKPRAKELCYIGQSNNLKERINQHDAEDYPFSKGYCYSYCELDEEKMDIAEAALINECKPKGNSDFKDNYPEDYEAVTLRISGYHESIPDCIER